MKDVLCSNLIWGFFYSIYDDLMLMNFYFVQVGPIGHGQYVSSFNNPNEVQIPCNRNVVWWSIGHKPLVYQFHLLIPRMIKTKYRKPFLINLKRYDTIQFQMSSMIASIVI